MTTSEEMETAFDAAIDHVRKSMGRGMKTADGESARDNLARLENELKAERENALREGSVDRDWFQRTVRWLVEWVPETELTLIAALGRIARAKPPGLH